MICCIDNCNYAVELGKKTFQLRLVGIQGSNILDGDKMFTLAIVWQLMKSYILSLLDKIAGQGHPIVDNGIIEWTNNKVFNQKQFENDTVFKDSID